MPASGRMARVTPGIWTHLGQRARGLARAQLPAGRDLVTGVDELRRLLPQRHRVLGLRLRRRRRRDPAPADRAVPRHLARRAARGRARHPLRLPRRRAVGSRARATASTPTSCCSTRTPWRLRRRSGRSRRSSATRWATRRQRDDRTPRRTSAAAWSSARRFDWEGDDPAAAAVDRHGHLRAARQGHDELHDRVPEELRGTYAGLAHPAVIEHLTRPGCHRDRAAADPPVHHARTTLLEPRAGELLGLQHAGLLRPARRLQLVGRPRRAGRRVPGHGAGDARRRARGDPRRRLQPHRRGERAGPTLCFRGIDNDGYYRAAQRPLRRPYYDRLRQHPRRVAAARRSADHGLAAVLGHRDARRRLPVRPGQRPGALLPRRRHAGLASCRPSSRTPCCEP